MAKRATPPINLEPDQVFVGRTRARRIVAVGNDHVLYNPGADRLRECQVKTFTAWIKRQRAEQAHHDD